MKQTTFAFPQTIDRETGKTILSTEYKSINECLGILLRTRQGELLGDPNYGCKLIERIFMYEGVIIETILKEDILDAVEKYEPRITLNEENITIVQNSSLVSIYLTYVIRETGQINQFNLEITPDDNPYKM